MGVHLISVDELRRQRKAEERDVELALEQSRRDGLNEGFILAANFAATLMGDGKVERPDLVYRALFQAWHGPLSKWTLHCIDHRTGKVLTLADPPLFDVSDTDDDDGDGGPSSDVDLEVDVDESDDDDDLGEEVEP